jgi:hypothetical protein
MVFMAKPLLLNWAIDFANDLQWWSISAELHQYTAIYNADLAAYRQTVLTAFQQVEDYLAAVRIYSHEIQRQQEAVKSAQEYLDLALPRYRRLEVAGIARNPHAFSSITESVCL